MCRLKQVAETTFGIPAESVPDDAAAGGFAPWNSLSHLELIMALEMEYRVVIPTERIRELSSLPAIENYLRAQGVDVN